MYELEAMLLNGVKAEIESAHLHAGFGTFVRDLADKVNALYGHDSEFDTFEPGLNAI